jgi:hypothetical protein
VRRNNSIPPRPNNGLTTILSHPPFPSLPTCAALLLQYLADNGVKVDAETKYLVGGLAGGVFGLTVTSALALYSGSAETQLIVLKVGLFFSFSSSSFYSLSLLSLCSLSTRALSLLSLSLSRSLARSHTHTRARTR